MYSIDIPRPPPRSPSETPGGITDLSWPLSIELDIPCAKCGYVLSGLKTDGRCPECDSPIVRSVFGDRLEYAAPGYVRLLRIGGTITSVAVAGMLAGVAITILPLLFYMLFIPAGPPNWLGAVFMFTFFILPGLCAGAALAGWWLMTMPDPAHLDTKADPRSRRWLRGVMIVESICWVTLSGLGLFQVLGNVPPTVYIPLAGTCGIIAPFALSAHLFLSAAYFRVMGKRLDSEFFGSVAYYQCAGAIVSALLVLSCFGAATLQSEGLLICCIILTLISVSVTAGIHLGMTEIIRRAAREAMRKMRKAEAAGPSERAWRP